jgi:uncharacterized protein YkwD
MNSKTITFLILSVILLISYPCIGEEDEIGLTDNPENIDNTDIPGSIDDLINQTDQINPDIPYNSGSVEYQDNMINLGNTDGLENTGYMSVSEITNTTDTGQDLTSGNMSMPIEPARQSDLIFTTDISINGSITPKQAEMGFPFSAGIEIVNSGPANAQDITINYYLVPFNETDAKPIWIHQKTAKEIPAFYRDTVFFTVTMPGGIKAGQYNLYTTLTTSTPDRDQANNQYISDSPIDVRRSTSSSLYDPADLLVTIDGISSSVTGPGYPFTINYTLFNVGSGSSGTFRIGFYLSQDEVISPSDLKLWDEIYYKSYPGMAEKGTAVDIIPEEIPQGEYFLGAIADFTHMVSEADEENNTFCFDTPVTILAVSPPVNESFLDRVSGYVAVKTNLYRQYRGLTNLSFDAELGDIARAHSIDMAERGYFAHETPEDIDPSDRAKNAGFDVTKRLSDGSIRTGIAENIVKIAGGHIIGKGFSGFVDPSDPQAVADVMMVEWISSPVHDKNLVNPDIDKIGVGVSYNGEFFYGTQNFY